MKTKKIYFDCEFTGLHQSTSLISIGLVTDDNKEFYAEFNDYFIFDCNKWIEDNVIKNLKFRDQYYKETSSALYMCNDKQAIANSLRKWLTDICSTDEEILFVSDCSHYDFVLLVDLLINGKGSLIVTPTALDLPENVVPACRDINQDIADHYDISLKEAFDMNREYMIYGNGIRVNGTKHNSLYDANVIKAIAENLHSF